MSRIPNTALNSVVDRIANPGAGVFFTPESRIQERKNPGTSLHISESLVTIFWV
jgi:hypothetical protein